MKEKKSFIGYKVLLLTYMLITPLLGFSQNITVKGTVTDSEGNTLSGVSVIVKASQSKGVVTDEKGNYSITGVSPNAVLRISYVGMVAQEISLNGRTTINVQLQEESSSLNDVVVVGYGTQKKETLTGAIAAVKGEEIKTPGQANVAHTLQGRMPGVIVKTPSGEPGADGATILVRGYGTFKNNNPLVVIDGVPGRLGLDRISPMDIESVSILKDASGAIYGAQAANGVILITTKRGTLGKPVISYEGNYSVNSFVKRPKLMEAYEYMNWADEMEMVNTGNSNPKFKSIKNGYLDGTINRNLYGNTDWIKATFADYAPQTRHSASIRGGSEDVKYYISGDYLYQKPQFRNTVFDFQTYQVISNFDANINKNLSVNLDLNVRRENRNNSIIPTPSLYWEAFNAYPYLYDYYPNGLPGSGVANGNNLAVLANGKDVGYDRIQDLYLNTKIGFDLKLPWITNGLSLNGYGAFDMDFNNRKKFNRTWETYNYDLNSNQYVKQITNMNGNKRDLTQSESHFLNKTFHIKLNYEKGFGLHNVSGFVAYEQNQYNFEGFNAYRAFFLSNLPDYLGFGGEREKTNGHVNPIQSARQNYFGRVNYGFNGRYLAEFTLRYDGSMNFPTDKRWGLFPAGSIGWRISEENFIKNNVKFVSDLKLRASWGLMGNDRVDPYQYITTNKMTDGAILGATPELSKGFVPDRIGNPDITWEVADYKNIGIDATLWKGLLGFSVDYFFQKRNNILTAPFASIPVYTGLKMPDKNIGKMNNQGIEVGVKHDHKIGNVKYNLGGNFTYVKNKVVFLDESPNIPNWQKETGLSMGTWLMHQADGIYTNQEQINNTPHLPGTKLGDIKYVDIDGDGQITDNDRIRSKYSNIPQIVYGIDMGIAWKNIEISALWYGQARVEQVVVPYSTLNNLKELYDGRFISENQTPNPQYPRAFDRSGNNAKRSTFWLQNTSFLRLRNVQIAYNLPKEILQKINMKNLRVFVTGTNLFTIDKAKFQDPESEGTSAGQAYPQLRSYTMGLSFSL